VSGKRRGNAMEIYYHEKEIKSAINFFKYKNKAQKEEKTLVLYETG
jgi:hypothetical protein